VKLSDFVDMFNAEAHPDVANGKKTPEQLMKEFIGKWFKNDFDALVTQEDFIDYYRDVSCSVD